MIYIPSHGLLEKNSYQRRSGGYFFSWDLADGGESGEQSALPHCAGPTALRFPLSAFYFPLLRPPLSAEMLTFDPSTWYITYCGLTTRVIPPSPDISLLGLFIIFSLTGMPRDQRSSSAGGARDGSRRGQDYIFHRVSMRSRSTQGAASERPSPHYVTNVIRFMLFFRRSSFPKLRQRYTTSHLIQCHGQ